MSWPSQTLSWFRPCLYNGRNFGEQLIRASFLIINNLINRSFFMWLKIRKQSFNREFKKLQRLLQRKRHIKIQLCVRFSILRLFHVDHVVQNRWSALSLAWYEGFSCKGKDWKIYCCELALLPEPQIWKFHVVVWQTTSKNCTKNRAALAARFFFFIQPIKSIICGVDVDVTVVKS